MAAEALVASSSLEEHSRVLELLSEEYLCALTAASLAQLLATIEYRVNKVQHRSRRQVSVDSFEFEKSSIALPIVDIPQSNNNETKSTTMDVELPGLIVNTSVRPYRLIDVDIPLAPRMNAGGLRRFSTLARGIIPKADEDQPIRILELPVQDIIEIDERQTLGRSLCGEQFGEVLADLRGMQWFSQLSFFSMVFATVLGYSIFFAETFQIDSDQIHFWLLSTSLIPGV